MALYQSFWKYKSVRRQKYWDVINDKAATSKDGSGRLVCGDGANPCRGKSRRADQDPERWRQRQEWLIWCSKSILHFQRGLLPCERKNDTKLLTNRFPQLINYKMLVFLGGGKRRFSPFYFALRGAMAGFPLNMPLDRGGRRSRLPNPFASLIFQQTRYNYELKVQVTGMI